jgi:hypothetical protein
MMFLTTSTGVMVFNSCDLLVYKWVIVAFLFCGVFSFAATAIFIFNLFDRRLRNCGSCVCNSSVNFRDASHK